MTFRLSGLVAAAHTPFDSAGQLALDHVEPQAEHLLRNGIRTVFVGGSTGESHSLALRERIALVQRWSEILRGTEIKLVVHVGANCLMDAREMAAHAQQVRAAAVSALAPGYFKPKSMQCLIDCCQQIASGAPELPFYFYDIPSMTGVHFAMHQFLEVAAEQIPKLAGIKFTNSDMMMYQQCLAVDQGRYDIPWGVDECLLAALALGAKGAVGSSYNFAAPIYQRLIEAYQAGDLDRARQEQRKSVLLIQLLSGYGYMGAAKSVMSFLGVSVGPPRLPNGTLTIEQQTQLRNDLECLGFFDWITV